MNFKRLSVLVILLLAAVVLSAQILSQWSMADYKRDTEDVDHWSYINQNKTQVFCVRTVRVGIYSNNQPTVAISCVEIK
jgi:hypothetical protein